MQSGSCVNPFIELGQLLESCGIEESKQKACPPSTRMIFIGVRFDSEKLTLSVTQERLQEILKFIGGLAIKDRGNFTGTSVFDRQIILQFFLRPDQ